MAVDFCDYFWGEKHEGFHVLYSNLKAGFMATKDLSDVIRETALVQENSSKVIYLLNMEHKNNFILTLISVLRQDQQAAGSFSATRNLQPNSASIEDCLRQAISNPFRDSNKS